MAQIRTMTLGLFLLAGVADFSLPGYAHAASCDAIVGKWAWFTKGVVAFTPDGKLVHEPGNDGTWECTDAARGRITLRWRLGGHVNHLVLSADGQGLSSTDPSQHFVTAKRIGAGGSTPPATVTSATQVRAPVALTTHAGWCAAVAQKSSGADARRDTARSTVAPGCDPCFAQVRTSRSS